MQELMREYGRILVSVIAGVMAVGILVYACICMAAYFEFFADCLMGGGWE